MIITRKIGSLIRGKATPFQIISACTLGALIGFIPSFGQAPGLTIFWALLLLILNANLFLAGVVGLLSKVVVLMGMPVVFWIGRFFLEGPLQGIFKALINAPVSAYFGLEYYAVTGGQFVGLILGLLLGFSLVRSLNAYRRKMKDVSEHSERMKAMNQKMWTKILKFVFLGRGKGKKTYDELMAVRVGNPVRIWGAGVALLVVVGIYFGANKLSGPFLTKLAEDQLSRANGATVDLDSVELSLKDGRLAAGGLAMTDPQDLSTNLFQASQMTADFSTTDLLRKRFSIDLLTFDSAKTGTARETPGELVGPQEPADEKEEQPGFLDLESVLANADVWKERLRQVRRWIEEAGGDGADEKAPSWKEELNDRIRVLGHSQVKADFLVEGSPTVLIRKLEAKGIDSHYFPDSDLVIEGINLSTQPNLVESPPLITIQSGDERLDFKLNLSGAQGSGNNTLKMLLKAVPVDSFAQDLTSKGEQLLSGGLVDLDIGGILGGANNDLTLKAAFDGTKAFISGNELNLDGLSLPLQIRGPLDNPGIKLESKALEKLALNAGKKKLFDKAAEELGISGEAGDEDQSTEDKLKNMLFKKLGGDD